MANLTIDELQASGTATASANVPIQDAGQATPETRRLNVPLLQVLASGLFAQVLSSGLKIAGSVLSITGSSAINTGLTTLSFAIVSLGQATSSGACWVSWSALASSGYFQAQVWALTSSGSATPVASSVAATVGWIGVGT